MTRDELKELCADPPKTKMKYWTSEIYGFGRWIRRYGFFPSRVPLNIYFSHGITTHEIPAPHELNATAPFMLYFAPRLVKAFKAMSKTPCFCLLSPNVFYRRTNNIRPSGEATGTVSFFSHTTPVIENNMDFSAYVRELRELPEKFQPVSICLHYHDVQKGIDKFFMDAGFSVVTVGHPYRTDFIERFYEVIRQFRYVTSNEIGSYAFYALEAGIPFFLYGTRPDYFNLADRNIEKGEYTSFRNTDHYRKVCRLFSLRVDEVTAEQKAFVEEELGVYNSISRIKLSGILYYAYLLLAFNRIKRMLKKLLGRTELRPPNNVLKNSRGEA